MIDRLSDFATSRWVKSRFSFKNRISLLVQRCRLVKESPPIDQCFPLAFIAWVAIHA